VSHAVIHVDAPKVPAYALELPDVGGKAEKEAPLPFPQADWIAAMDAERGAKVFKKCTSCHNNEAGGAHGTGPNLYGVVGAKIAAKDGFKYSSAFNSSDLSWTYEDLDGYLARPTKYISGTAMNFVGLKKPADRAAVIEYLRVGAAAPLPRPEAAAVPAAMEASVDTMNEGETPSEAAPEMAIKNQAEMKETMDAPAEQKAGEIMDKAKEAMTEKE
jgi:cytochrome c